MQYYDVQWSCSMAWIHKKIVASKQKFRPSNRKKQENWEKKHRLEWQRTKRSLLHWIYSSDRFSSQDWCITIALFCIRRVTSNVSHPHFLTTTFFVDMLYFYFTYSLSVHTPNTYIPLIPFDMKQEKIGICLFSLLVCLIRRFRLSMPTYSTIPISLFLFFAK